MLKEAFEGSFYSTFPSKKGLRVNLSEDIFSGAFSLSDPLACELCPLCKTDGKNRENIKIFSSNLVYVISFNDVVSFVQDGIGELCDYVLASDRTVVFLEMTCSKADYVKRYEGGKRMKARSQLRNSICVCSASPNVLQFMRNRRDSCFAVFSWKEPWLPSDDGDSVEQSFRSFTEIEDEIYSLENSQEMLDGFLYKEIRYPDVLSFDKMLNYGKDGVY